MNKRRFVRYLLQEPYSFVILLRNIIHPLSDTSRCALNYVGTYYMLRRDVILWNSITIIPPFARY